MAEDDWVDAFEGASVADLDWYRNQSQNGSEPDARWQPIDLAQIPDEPPAKPELGGLGLAYRGKRHVFSGPQESAKTLAAYVLGLSVLRTGGAFCLIDFEMGRWDARTRLRELGATSEELGSIVYFEPEGRMPERVPGEVVASVGERDAIVLIDAAAGAFAFEELDDNKRMDVERFAMVYVEPFRRAGIATLVLDHVVKSSEARGNYAIGSERKVGQTDVHLGFSVVRPISRGDHGLYKVTTHKDRGGCLKRGHLCDFRLDSDPDTHAISWEFVAPQVVDEAHPFRPTGLMESVSRYLERIMEPVPRGQIENEIKGKRDYIRLALDVLTSEGYLVESEGARGARLYLCAEAYREGSDLAPDLAPTSPRDPVESTSPPRPSPYGGATAGDLAPMGELTSPRSLLEDDDGIPF